MVNILNFVNNNLILVVVFALFIMAYVVFEFFNLFSKDRSSNKISPNQLIDLFNHKNAVLIDIRPENQYINGHIVGSINIPFDVCNKEHRLIKCNTNKNLIIVDDYGKLASTCTYSLLKDGIKEVSYLEGGLHLWCSQNMPLIKNPPKLNIVSSNNNISGNYKEQNQRSIDNNNNPTANKDDIIIYTKDSCPYCVSAKNLLHNKGYDYTEIYISDTNSKEFKEMVSLSGGVKTFPQIFINNKHIGGFDSLKALSDKGELDQVLTTGKLT
jgi:glutaredoxin 3